MITYEEVIKIKRRVLKRAAKRLSDADLHYLETQDAFCSPAAFWDIALNKGVCTMEEYKKVKEYYQNQPVGDMWHYAGD